MKSVSFSLMAATVLCSVWCLAWGGDMGDAHLESTIHRPDDAVDGCSVMDSAQVLSDMAHPSEALPIKPEFEWAYRPVVTMRAPRGDAIPKWWKGNRPTWTNVILSWFTLFEAQDNTAQNSSVQVGSLRVFIYSKREHRWIRVDLTRIPEVSLWKYPFSHVDAAGYWSVDILNQAERKYKPAYPFFYHGWGRATEIDAPDIGAVFVAMEFRLARIDSAREDDRNRARLLVGVGADYYPDRKLRWSMDFAPGVGNGRLLLAKNVWRTATFFTMDLTGDALQQDAMLSLPTCER